METEPTTGNYHSGSYHTQAGWNQDSKSCKDWPCLPLTRFRCYVKKQCGTCTPICFLVLHLPLPPPKGRRSARKRQKNLLQAPVHVQGRNDDLKSDTTSWGKGCGRHRQSCSYGHWSHTSRIIMRLRTSHTLGVIFLVGVYAETRVKNISWGNHSMTNTYR